MALVEQIEPFTTSNGLAASSSREYTYILKNFLAFLGKKKITRQNVVGYKNKCIKEQRSARTISLRLIVIKGFAKYLWEEDLITEKEYKKISSIKFKLPVGEDNRQALTPEQETIGYKKIGNPLLRMMFWTGLHYGLRRQEYINLKLNEVDLKNQILTIRLSKGQKTRKIPILKSHIPIWKKWFQTREAYSLDHSFIFFTERGKAGKRTLEKYFTKIADIIDVKLTSHTLRYTFAVKCWRARMDLLVLSKILGHASLTTTQTYLRVTEEEIIKKYIEQASNVL